MMWRQWMIMALALLMVGPVVRAEPAGDVYPTVAALEATDVPAADPVELARAFRGVGDIPAPPKTAQTRMVGEREVFRAFNTTEKKELEIPATLRVVGKHIYLWVEEGIEIELDGLQLLANLFDETIYAPVRRLWGSEASPGIDGDPRLYGLFAHGLGDGVAAYFASRHVYPREVYPDSNEHEMFFFNLDSIGTLNVARLDVQSTVAHEFQHMIRARLQDNEDIWMNEGFSTFTQLYLYGDSGFVNSFVLAPETQLNTWAEDGPRQPHYGAAVLFVAYFFERFGPQALQALSADPATGMKSFDHVLKRLGQEDVNALFADWAVANGVMDPMIEDGRYGYRLLERSQMTPPGEVIATYPYLIQREVNQYAANYYTLTGLTGKTTLEIGLGAPETVKLVPTDPTSGEWMWYSNRGDLSHMTLTRAFDLMGVERATLQYRLWYDNEDFWDYGYVSVSTDGGQRWTILRAPGTTNDNPLSSGYGPGYTTQSEGWLDAAVSLAPYAGQKIQVRFELINDEAVNNPGMALDDVAIPEIGYRSDFETDDGGWEPAGWIRTDNRLPQKTWVQVIERKGAGVKVTRWAGEAGGQWNLTLDGVTNQALLVVSPYAPVTTMPMPYLLDVNAR